MRTWITAGLFQTGEGRVLGKIYCTPATRELTQVLLMDSAEIQQDE